ncbi:MAG: zinc-ribbon domain-containing protein [candidate division WOR-3 bacterium]
MAKRRIFFVIIIISLLSIFIFCAKQYVPPKVFLPSVPEGITLGGDISKIFIYNFTPLPPHTGNPFSYIAWAPDDSSIFYASEDGKNNQLYNFRTGYWIYLREKKPDWVPTEWERIQKTINWYSESPDGCYGVIIRDSDKELIIYQKKNVSKSISPADLYGRTLSKIVGGRVVGKPAWSHNGKYIALAVKGVVRSEFHNNPQTAIFITNPVFLITLGGYKPQILQPSSIEEKTPSIKVCPQCGNEYPDSYNRCPKCGTKLKFKEELKTEPQEQMK